MARANACVRRGILACFVVCNAPENQGKRFFCGSFRLVRAIDRTEGEDIAARGKVVWQTTAHGVHLAQEQSFCHDFDENQKSHCPHHGRR